MNERGDNQDLLRNSRIDCAVDEESGSGGPRGWVLRVAPLGSGQGRSSECVRRSASTQQHGLSMGRRAGEKTDVRVNVRKSRFDSLCRCC